MVVIGASEDCLTLCVTFLILSQLTDKQKAHRVTSAIEPSAPRGTEQAWG